MIEHNYMYWEKYAIDMKSNKINQLLPNKNYQAY